MFEKRPLIIYDGDCRICCRWINFQKHKIKKNLFYSPYQDVPQDFLNIPLKQFQKSLHYIDEKDHVFAGAYAVCKLWSYREHLKWVLWLYENIPGFSFVAELLYQLVAKNRARFQKP
ncbi:MAG: DUF393 domain-containing protein [Deltaproteobacteria bacterium]|nr:DUF393 domain-containing protein [Deltaproteobacteria bacterium]